MDRETMRGWMMDLAKSQGFYRRLLKALDDCPPLWDDLESMDFKTPVDMVMFVEGY